MQHYIRKRKRAIIISHTPSMTLEPRSLVKPHTPTPYTSTPKRNTPTPHQCTTRTNAHRVTDEVLAPHHPHHRTLTAPMAPLPPRRTSPHRQRYQLPPHHHSTTPATPATTQERTAVWYNNRLITYGTATHTRHEDGTHTLTRNNHTIQVRPYIPPDTPLTLLRDVRCYEYVPPTHTAP